MVSRPLFFTLAQAAPQGVKKASAILPYGLSSSDFLRVAEDIHRFLYEVNWPLHQLGYPPLEDLLDPAGFSGLISRFAAERLSRASKGLVVNQWHNGYPDLIPAGVYPNNAVESGTDGFEIKASRYESGWQGHSVRTGWFCVVQFLIDDSSKGFGSREPTRVNCILAADVDGSDWNWHKAKEDASRSGTTQLRPSGTEKLRSNALYVDPAYSSRHVDLLNKVVYRNRLAERKQLFTITGKALCKELGIGPKKLKDLIMRAPDPDVLYFDFGQGQTKQRRFAIDAADNLRPLLAPEDQS